MKPNRFAVITGSSGGIGYASVMEFLGAGYRVFGLDVEKRDYPQGCSFIKVDVASEQLVTGALKQLGSETDRIHALVNNAAVCTPMRLLETSVGEWDRILASNLKSVFLMTKACHPYLKRAGHAGIVNVSSVHAACTSEGMGAYAAAKGGMNSFTRAAALELASDGIRVNCVMPGAVDTPMLCKGSDRDSLPGHRIEDAIAHIAARTPLRRIGDPSEIARTILFLASHESAGFITGQTVVADGGALARLSTE